MFEPIFSRKVWIVRKFVPSRKKSSYKIFGKIVILTSLLLRVIINLVNAIYAKMYITADIEK